MFDTAIGGDQICSATQVAELPQNARQDQPGWVARNAGSPPALAMSRGNLSIGGLEQLPDLGPVGGLGVLQPEREPAAVIVMG